MKVETIRLIMLKDLHDRKKLKQEKNPAQMVIKLLMNPMYGKTIIKPVETNTVVKDNRNDFERYISYNYNYIYSVIEVNQDITLYIKKVTQYCTILIMSIAVLRF